jgi:hypothetical protein
MVVVLGVNARVPAAALAAVVEFRVTNKQA